MMTGLMADKIRVVVAGYGNMGFAHSVAYKQLDGFELVGIVGRNQQKLSIAAKKLNIPPDRQFCNFEAAIKILKPDAVSICTYVDTHAEFTLKALARGMHVFVEKPIAQTVAEARQIVRLANKKKKKVVVGYILRHHPVWIKFIEIARTLGKPLVMRMNLNQQSSADKWFCHKQLMNSMSPIVDCGVHYVDVMCQMTQSKPVSVHAIGARLTDEIKPKMYNYGQLQVVFKDSSVGWYEAAWGPMVSETAFFVKDVVGPKGCVSIVERKSDTKAGSDDIESHTKTNRLRIHSAQLGSDGNFINKDTFIDTTDEPDHQQLCNLEQSFFLRAIRENLDLSSHLEDAVNSLRIVLAADKSVSSGKVVKL
jgi:predicted dehydrogenase